MKKTPPPYWDGRCAWCKSTCEPTIVIHWAVYCSIACENTADDPPPAQGDQLRVNVKAQP